MNISAIHALTTQKTFISRYVPGTLIRIAYFSEKVGTWEEGFMPPLEELKPFQPFYYISCRVKGDLPHGRVKWLNQ